MRAVIYARYSSDNQREESIEGQLRECLQYAILTKWKLQIARKPHMRSILKFLAQKIMQDAWDVFRLFGREAESSVQVQLSAPNKTNPNH